MKQQIAAWCLAGLTFSAPALADLKIGFVDPRAVLSAAAESKAGKQHNAEMEKFVKDKQVVLKKEDDKLKSLGQSLEKEMLTLSDAQKEQKQKDFQDKITALRNMAKDAEQETVKKDTEFKKRVEDEIRKAVDEVARDEKVNLVLSKMEVFYVDAGTGTDLTAKVVQKVEAAMQKLETKDGGKKK
jgi:outer membrane protein